MRFFIIFLSVPLIELIILIEINRHIGLFYTIFLIITTAVVGSIAVKRQGLSLIMDFQKQPSNLIHSMKNGLLILIAGVLLLTPGFITDIIGFSLLITPVRAYIIVKIEEKFSQNKLI